ncbi:class IV lanthionine synthetase LanL [Kitasatospora sp. NBC_01266]|uniref:class IV lanthionine synthetase LanL n=1 Tax=Kitasatospora sp. NBC_01266 TaxID=2903572 RepID=UPI002E35BBB1|nr:class IV lanthionine synthetase LanL [Kitasatospora sp. NBC_01266]
MTETSATRSGPPDEDGELLPGLVRSALRRQGAFGWEVDPGEFWCRVVPGGHSPRAQGWKLHISATPLSAPVVLAQAAEVLVAERAAFKFAGTLGRVADLVSPRYDRGGGGKFITVYPDDDDHFRRLVEELHQVTRGLPGPGILSDRPYCPGSLVHYRYGVFHGVTRLGNDGTVESMLRAPDGGFVRDRRQAWFSPPAWAGAPLLPAPTPAPTPAQSQPPQGAAAQGKASARSTGVLLDGRYAVRKAIRHAYKGGVYFATDQETGRQVVIKEARRHVGARLTGTDAGDLLQHEARMHAAMGPLGVCAEALGVFTQGGNLYLVQERIDGQTLRGWAVANPEPTRAALLDLAERTLTVVERVHRAGQVLRDLNPNNLMLTSEGEVRLIDLEMVARPGEQVQRAYTPGYAGPEVVDAQFLGPAPELTSDLYSLGAVLFHLASGAELLLAADQPAFRTADERLAHLVTRTLADNPGGRPFAPLILGLTAQAADRRWSLERAREFLAELRADRQVVAVDRADDPSEFVLSKEIEDQLLGDGLTHLLESMTATGRPRLWPADGFAALNDPLNVQYGAAGVLAVLAGAAGVRLDLRLRSGVVEAAEWIAGRLRLDEPQLPGLYFGRAGTAWALLDAARLLADRALLETASQLARQLPVRWPNPDVCHGAAGAGLAQLHFWRVTGAQDFLDRTVEIGEGLLAAAGTGRAGVIWQVPADFDSALAGARHLGFGHGVAGIGTFLLLAGQAAGREDFLELARRAGETLVTAAQVEDGAAWWPTEDKAIGATGAGPAFQPPYWCSGSAGVGSFLGRLWQATADQRYRDLAEQAAAEVYRRRWQLSPAACHGLAGNAEFLLDLAAVLEEPRYRGWAGELVACAHARHTLREGLMLLPGESGTEVTAGYSTGTAGMLAVLLRLRYGGTRLWLPEGLTLPAPAGRLIGAEAGPC